MGTNFKMSRTKFTILDSISVQCQILPQILFLMHYIVHVHAFILFGNYGTCFNKNKCVTPWLFSIICALLPVSGCTYRPMKSGVAHDMHHM